MFVCSLKTKLSARKVVLLLLTLVLVCIVVVATLMIDVPKSTATCEKIGEYNTQIKDDSVNDFLTQFSLEAEQLYSEQYIHIPYDFNDTYLKYNELQKRQGLDLLKYRGKKCNLLTYKLKDKKIDYSDVYITIIVYKDKVIGGHISTLVMDSPLYTFCGD